VLVDVVLQAPADGSGHGEKDVAEDEGSDCPARQSPRGLDARCEGHASTRSSACAEQDVSDGVQGRRGRVGHGALQPASSPQPDEDGSSSCHSQQHSAPTCGHGIT
jgi:hypothetical protein